MTSPVSSPYAIKNQKLTERTPAHAKLLEVRHQRIGAWGVQQGLTFSRSMRTSLRALGGLCSGIR
jgi:hypothetical protein